MREGREGYTDPRWTDGQLPPALSSAIIMPWRGEEEGRGRRGEIEMDRYSKPWTERRRGIRRDTIAYLGPSRRGPLTERQMGPHHYTLGVF